jgi:hypothetical protein
VVNGWRYPPREERRFGDDFLRRAADQSLAGIAANDPAESVYLMNFEDPGPLTPVRPSTIGQLFREHIRVLLHVLHDIGVAGAAERTKL